jgi:hypothetical protein
MEIRMMNGTLQTNKLWAIAGIAGMIAKEPDSVGITDLSCSWVKPDPFGGDLYVWISIITKRKVIVEIFRDMVSDEDNSLDLAYRIAGYCHFEGIKVVWK